MFRHAFQILFFLCIFPLFGQETVTVMSYNLLNYPGRSADKRNPDFRKVVRSVNPDILVVQEMNGREGIKTFLNDVLNWRGYDYAAGDYIDGEDSDNGIFFKRDQFQFLENKAISTNLREHNRFQLLHTPSGNTFFIFSVHLKAGRKHADRRLSEIRKLRRATNRLPADADFLICGDFNIYSSEEPAFTALLDSDKSGYVIDPLNLPGKWHNNKKFAAIHTQSTRSKNFGGGSGGGSDDRFDMMLLSREMMAAGGIEYVLGSYQAVGQDGKHFNKAINAKPLSISKTLANALHDASDHLPVVLDLMFAPKSQKKQAPGSEQSASVLFLRNYPNPFNISTTIEYQLGGPGMVELTIYNWLSKKVKTLLVENQPGGLHQLNWDGTNAQGERVSTGIYRCELKTGNITKTRNMMFFR